MASSFDVRRTAVGFLAALVVLTVLVWFVGVDALLAALSRADPAVLVPVGLAASMWLLAWSFSLKRVLFALGISVSATQAVSLYAVAVFTNNVTPFGQAGGEPFTALFIASSTDSEYETGLAAIASVDTLNVVPSITFALLGLGYYAATVTLDDRLETVAFALIAVVAVLPLLAIAGWNRRRRVEARVVAVIRPAGRVIGRTLPGLSPPRPGTLQRRVRGFVLAIERIAAEPRDVAVALAYSTVGWFAMATCLWASMVAIGYADLTLFPAALVAIPLGTMASVLPLPGGLGGIETVLVAVLVPITPLSVPAAGAAVVIYRGATYVVPTFVGAGVASALGAGVAWTS